ncbi:MAG: hypothetical protein K2Z81_11265, partial [Cyanobacteria bacterium]|nr:hypothetical protein [Cyanobacteriota bacterium]
TGLGLYTCRKIVEAHGGTITCLSPDDMSVTFRVTLPLSMSACFDDAESSRPRLNSVLESESEGKDIQGKGVHRAGSTH